MENVTALELRKNLQEITKQVRDGRRRKMLVVHGEPNLVMAPANWYDLIDKTEDMPPSSIQMNAEYAKMLKAQADSMLKSKTPVELKDLLDEIVKRASIVGQYLELEKG